MNQPASGQKYVPFIPPDAEQVQHFPTGQIRYLLPGNAHRLYPVHVFVGDNMLPATVDEWYEAVTETLQTCSDPSVYFLHDGRNPNIQFSAHFLIKARELAHLRPKLRGASGLILRPGMSSFLSLFQTLAKSIPSPRPTHLFFEYQSALDWLISQMQ